MQILVNIDVPDLTQAIRFYQAALPLHHARTLFDGSIAELLGANARIYLIEQAAGTAPAPGTSARDYRRHWTPVHFDVVVEDIAAALQRALSAGAVQESPPQDLPWGRLVNLSDPFGNGFCLLQFPGGIYESGA